MKRDTQLIDYHSVSTYIAKFQIAMYHVPGMKSLNNFDHVVKYHQSFFFGQSFLPDDVMLKRKVREKIA